MHHPLRGLLAAVTLFLLALAAHPAAQPASAQTARLCFPNVPGITNCIEGRFRQYWEQNGGLPVFGYPITPARNEVNRDTGQTYLTQWFERNRFELHPENRPPYDVLLGRLGDDQLRRQAAEWPEFPGPKGPIPGCLWFPETGHNVCDEADGPQFRTYWENHGLRDPRLSAYGKSLALLGYPLTEQRMEVNSSGYYVRTQWFERARLEWHPDKPFQPTRYTVLLGLLGNELRSPLAQPRAGDLEKARDTLIAYFSALNNRRYNEAVGYYGGSYETMRPYNPALPPTDYAGLFEHMCRGLLECLKIRRVVSQEAVVARGFSFVVEFSNPDGSLFRHGPCCGATEEEQPTRTQFPYVVTKIDNRFLVQGLPLYVP